MFKLVSKYKPNGDQPQAIEKLVDGLNKGYKEQILLFWLFPQKADEIQAAFRRLPYRQKMREAT